MFQPIFRSPRPAPGNEADMAASRAEFHLYARRQFAGVRHRFRPHERVVQGMQDECWHTDTSQVRAATGLGVVIVNAGITVQGRGDPVVEGMEISQRRQFVQGYGRIRAMPEFVAVACFQRTQQVCLIKPRKTLVQSPRGDIEQEWNRYRRRCM